MFEFKLKTAVLVGMLTFFLQSAALAQQSKGLNRIIRFDEHVSAGFFGVIVNDFSKATIVTREFDKLSKQLDDRDELMAFLEKLKQEENVLGIAVFLNQRYPEKKLIPITNGFPMADTCTIPLDLFVAGKKQTINVSSRTFGQILYGHWQCELGLVKELPDAKQIENPNKNEKRSKESAGGRETNQSNN